ncbi:MULTISPECIES: hypothetical protein [unclassified Streptomyces]|uniref:hypothetical protein n=1 Tax=unclassified Streptomyces TaxID=2593676 RepID=UPI002DD98FDE|nr:MULTISPECIES: hypothetical protein [unclassified Streptomyces]WSF81827.1 hypothetical protein OIE70_00610 [Streptomyces sp. NBC_01744]WSC34195.1 hypothetical protein OHA08_00605 [Streptomyces sp. NBC_01763]WSC41863.1 hypothetical protein OHA08_44375 [Streptomyces sp. NBC_01763]WSC42621.1 hypothetical protein OIE61_00515 [Streptomyces sp. NBC_01762]WSC50232.1 hypothetical protein OIE61_43960 [Streptomyces sp. NBC_01762]
MSRIAGTLHLVALTAAARRDMAGMLDDDLYDLDRKRCLLSLTETSRNWGTSGSRADDDADTAVPRARALIRGK